MRSSGLLINGDFNAIQNLLEKYKDLSQNLYGYLTKSFDDFLSSILSTGKEISPESYICLVRKILDCIVNILYAAKQENSNDPKISCGLMFLEHTNNFSLKDVLFYQGNEGFPDCKGILSIDSYCNKGQRLPYINIPFLNDSNNSSKQQLIGAPLSLHLKKVQLISDTLAINKKEHEDINEKTWFDMMEYFELEKDILRTFVSIPLYSDSKLLGVLNLNSSEPFYFDDIVNNILAIIDPFVVQIKHLMPLRPKRMEKPINPEDNNLFNEFSNNFGLEHESFKNYLKQGDIRMLLSIESKKQFEELNNLFRDNQEESMFKINDIDITYDEIVQIPPKKRYSVDLNIINTRKGVLKVIEEEEIL